MRWFGPSGRNVSRKRHVAASHSFTAPSWPVVMKVAASGAKVTLSTTPSWACSTGLTAPLTASTTTTSPAVPPMPTVRPSAPTVLFRGPLPALVELRDRRRTDDSARLEVDEKNVRHALVARRCSRPRPPVRPSGVTEIVRPRTRAVPALRPVRESSRRARRAFRGPGRRGRDHQRATPTPGRCARPV